MQDKFIATVCKRTAEQNLSEDESLKRDAEARPVEFVARGAKHWGATGHQPGYLLRLA